MQEKNETLTRIDVRGEKYFKTSQNKMKPKCLELESN